MSPTKKVTPKKKAKGNAAKKSEQPNLPAASMQGGGTTAPVEKVSDEAPGEQAALEPVEAQASGQASEGTEEGGAPQDSPDKVEAPEGRWAEIQAEVTMQRGYINILMQIGDAQEDRIETLEKALKCHKGSVKMGDIDGLDH